MLKYASLLIAITALLGCAKRPDAITPASIPMAAYTNLSCAELKQAHATERARLSGLSAAQNSAATGDAVGVFLIGVPAASLTGGDKEGDVAVSKGKIEAMSQAALAKRCILPAA